MVFSASRLTGSKEIYESAMERDIESCTSCGEEFYLKEVDRKGITGFFEQLIKGKKLETNIVHIFSGFGEDEIKAECEDCVFGEDYV